jgi:cytochrome c oxidase subunit IV
MTKSLIFLNILIATTMLTLFTCNHFYYSGNHSIIFGTWADHFFQKKLLAAFILTIPMTLLFKRKSLIISIFLPIICFGIYYFIINILAD